MSDVEMRWWHSDASWRARLTEATDKPGTQPTSHSKNKSEQMQTSDNSTQQTSAQGGLVKFNILLKTHKQQASHRGGQKRQYADGQHWHKNKSSVRKTRLIQW